MIAPVNDVHAHRLLDMYSPRQRAALGPSLELVHLASGQLLYNSGQRMAYVYFPTTAIVSLLSLMEDGATMEIAAVGNEGIVGVPVVMGSDSMPYRVEVRSGGLAYRITAANFKREFAESVVMRRSALLYVQSLLTQISQSAACNRHHSLSRQLCRWLLLTLDRVPTNKLAVTQQSIANMLGVRREGVTEAAGRLEEAGIISHARGQITVIDRVALERGACECYSVVKKEFERLYRYVAELDDAA